jgi:hypothetical protein
MIGMESNGVLVSIAAQISTVEVGSGAGRGRDRRRRRGSDSNGEKNNELRLSLTVSLSSQDIGFARRLHHATVGNDDAAVDDCGGSRGPAVGRRRRGPASEAATGLLHSTGERRSSVGKLLPLHGDEGRFTPSKATAFD